MINSIRNITFIILAVLSSFLAVNMFFQFGTSPIEKFVFVLVTVALEGLKIFTIVNANINWDSGKKFKGVIRYFAYVFIAFISIVASLGYTLTTINRINETAKVSSNSALIQSYNDQAVYYKGLKASNEATIASNTKILSTLTSDYNTTLPSLVEQKDKDKLTADYLKKKKSLEDTNTGLTQKNSDYFAKQIDYETRAREAQQKDVESASFQKTSDSMFLLIGKMIGLSEQVTMFLILVIVSVNIEVGIIFTAPHPTLEKKKKKKKIKDDRSIKSEEDDDEEDEEDEIIDEKPFEVSAKTLATLDHSIDNLKKGIVSEPVILNEKIPTVQPKPIISTPPIIEVQKASVPIKEENLIKEKINAQPKKQEPTLRRILNEEEKEKLIENIEKVIDEIRNQGGKKFSIESLSAKTEISLDEIKKMFQYLSNLNLLNFDESTKTWKFKINRDEILNYLRNLPTIKY